MCIYTSFYLYYFMFFNYTFFKSVLYYFMFFNYIKIKKKLQKKSNNYLLDFWLLFLILCRCSLRNLGNEPFCTILTI